MGSRSIGGKGYACPNPANRSGLVFVSLDNDVAHVVLAEIAGVLDEVVFFTVGHRSIGLFVLDLELLAGLLARPLLGGRGLRLLRLGRRLRLWRAARAARLQQRLRIELRAAGGADDGRLQSGRATGRERVGRYG